MSVDAADHANHQYDVDAIQRNDRVRRHSAKVALSWSFAETVKESIDDSAQRPIHP
jgi:hypothetical protein